ncbi:MAG: endonuclease V [Sandaracinaceae bacterium]|nr:endonuclease V [Sandaracinaceae bacterium]
MTRPGLTSDPAEAEGLQGELAPRVELNDRLDPVRRVAGADIAYEIGGDRLWAAVCVLDATTLSVIEVARFEGVATFPYVPGLLSFRELPALLACFEALRRPADLVVCDGNGILHPRRLGVASHLGLLLDVPAIGCAKNQLLGTAGSLGLARGDHAPIEEAGEHVGDALRTQPGVKPLYVSPGHRVSFATARAWVLKLAPTYRQPEVIREADQEVRRMRAAATGA